MSNFPNVVIKLGLEDSPQEKALFRRITPEQLRKDGAGAPLSYLRKQAVLLFHQAADTNVGFGSCTVFLRYKDTEGDYMVIHTPEDLTAALKEYIHAGKIKIFAQIRVKGPQEGTSPSVHSATQTASPPADHESLNVTDAVEHVVGAIASATIMAANQVTRSLREIKRAERQIIRPIRVATVMRGGCRPNASKQTADTASGEDVSPQQEDEVKAASSPESGSSEANATQEEETDTKPEPKTDESDAAPDTSNNGALQFIHGRHTCDGCLNTPIVGKRFHATPDYDLCETCFHNYTGDRKFEEMELDQDRLFQERWKSRWETFRKKGLCACLQGSIYYAASWTAHVPFKQTLRNSVLEQHDHDLALKEALCQSLAEVKDEPVAEDVKPNEATLEEALRRSDAEAEAEEARAVERAIELSIEEVSRSECSTPQTNTPIVSPDRSVASKSSFAHDAAGCGDVATDLGEALDKIANEIDEMTLELGRPEENNKLDDMESIAEDVSLKSEDEPDADSKKGATIIEGTEPTLTREETDFGSKNSWHVVDSDDDGVVLDANEALGRAAQMIGSALFNSDMERTAQSAAPAESLSSVSSVPTTVHLDRAQQHNPVPDQLERWSLQLSQLHELGFLNDRANVETIERLAAANIGVNCTDEVSVQQVIDEMMKDW